MFRQGDVLITKIDESELPGRNGVSFKHSTPILAFGEVTGHSHKVSAIEDTAEDPADWWKRSDDDTAEFLHIKDESGAVITHEEHNPIQLPKGAYKISIQREYEPGPLQEKKVID